MEKRRSAARHNTCLIGAGFYITPAAPDVVFQLPMQCIESITDDYIGIFMGPFIVVLATDDQLFLRYGQIDAHVEEVALIVMPVGSFYDDTTTHDFFTKFFQLGGFLTNSGLHCRRRFDMTEGDL